MLAYFINPSAHAHRPASSGWWRVAAPVTAGTQGVAIVARPAPVGLPHTFPRPLVELRVSRAGWARTFFFFFARAASEAAPFMGPSLSPSAWLCFCVLAAAAAACVGGDSAAVGAGSWFGGPSCCLAASATTAAISATPSGDRDSATNGAGDSADPSPVRNSSAAGPPFIGSNVAVGCAAEDEIKSPPRRQQSQHQGQRVSCAVSVDSAATATSVSTCHVTPGPAAAPVSSKPVTSTPALAASAASSPSAAADSP
ncbi:unnamed protein product [Closterium sp. NIES-65]|nr:unnamed protein product [Closterium sp. NIES-65]